MRVVIIQRILRIVDILLYGRIVVLDIELQPLMHLLPQLSVAFCLFLDDFNKLRRNASYFYSISRMADIER